jgi:hypothetical protein
MSLDKMMGQQTAYEQTKNFCTKLKEDIVKQGYKGSSVQSVIRFCESQIEGLENTISGLLDEMMKESEGEDDRQDHRDL